MMLKILRAISCALVLSLAGCALTPKLEAPDITLKGVSMTSADIFSQSFLVRVHVRNPNDRDIPVKSIDYKLFLEGDSFAEGLMSDPFVIPALGETEFEVPIRTNFVSSLGRLVSRLQGRKEVNYVLEGKVQTDLGIFKKIPFRETGSMDLTTLK
jgi:LEA14-like dessication related protein